MNGYQEGIEKFRYLKVVPNKNVLCNIHTWKKILDKFLLVVHCFHGCLILYFCEDVENGWL